MARPQRAKDSLETAALRCFARQGVEATSIADIARDAGTSTAAIYHFYRSKDDLVRQLFADRYRAFGMRLAEAVGPHEGTHRRIEAMVHETCRLHDETPDLFRFLLLVQHQSLPRLDTVAGTPVEVVRAVIAEGIARGQVPEQDPDLAASLVLGVVLQPATFVIYGRLPGPMSAMAERLTCAAWSALSSAPAAGRSA